MEGGQSMKKYKGKRNPDVGGPFPVFVTGDDHITKDLDPRYDLVNHSPDGFQWGYGGSAQLAIALLADATGHDYLAKLCYQQFKREVVATLPNEFQLTDEQIVKWVEHWAGTSQKAEGMENFLDDMSKSMFGRSRKDPACVTCGSTKVQNEDFVDLLSWKEFNISRMCQECQDKTFGGR